MEFDINKVYTAVNADELPIGSKCIFANTIKELEYAVNDKKSAYISNLNRIRGKDNVFRFVCENNSEFILTYLIDLPNNQKKQEYKPFSSVEKAMEVIKNHGGWIKDKITENQFFVNSYCRDIISTKTEWLNMQELFRKYVFIDDDSPCGELAD